MTHYYMDAQTGLYVVPATFYKFPTGDRLDDTAPIRDQETGKKADEILNSGFVFEGEILSTGDLSMTITSDEMDHVIVIISGESQDRMGDLINKWSDAINSFDIAVELQRLQEIRENA